MISSIFEIGSVGSTVPIQTSIRQTNHAHTGLDEPPGREQVFIHQWTGVAVPCWFSRPFSVSLSNTWLLLLQVQRLGQSVGSQNSKRLLLVLVESLNRAIGIRL